MILIRPSFDRAFNKLNPQQQARVSKSIGRLEGAFGRPHLHGGIGLRSVGNYFECRAGLDLRLLFVASHGDLVLVTVGSHDHIARFIRNA
jgi:mRNA-degrading endonuclease YafQ of YafQ-DinJ toxin-antitoxin module